MFFRITTIFTFLFLALPILVAATAVPRTDLCSAGSLQCCNSLESADSTTVTTLAALLGLILDPSTGLVGLSCTPISVTSPGGISCSAQPACCTGSNNFGGLLIIDCTPIDINL